MMSKKHTEQSFWGMVDIRGPDVCWHWSGSPNRAGYGVLSYQSATWRAHRLAAHFSGMDLSSPEACVCHRCDQPTCCNPAHLFVGTHAENMADRAVKGRGPRGERHPIAKLTDEVVRAARSAYATGGVTIRELARVYGVTHQAIHPVLMGRTWKHVK